MISELSFIPTTRYHGFFHIDSSLVAHKLNEIIRALNAIESANTANNRQSTPLVDKPRYCQFCGIRLTGIHFCKEQ
jgi:hypothetical protein